MPCGCGDQSSVAVVGMGVASALGADLRTSWDRLVAGRPGTAALADFSYRGRELPVGRCADEALASALRASGREVQPGDARAMRLAECVAAQALGAARGGAGEPERFGIYLGSSLTTSDYVAEQYERYYGGKRPPASALIDGMNCQLACQLAMRFGATGPVHTVSTSCSSSLQALLFASRDLRLGIVDRALVVGVDSCFARTIVDPWLSARVLSMLSPAETACRPFCATRRGLVYAEGAAALLLARPEGAPGELQIRGGAVRHDVQGKLATGREAMVRCMRAALEDARVEPSQIGVVQANAAGSPWLDQVEAEALGELFGRRVPIQAAKAFVGSALGAAALVDVVFTLLALRERWLPANVNVFERDPRIEPLIDCYYQARELPDAAMAIVNAFGFGGTNASVIAART